MDSFICEAARIGNQELLILRPGESSKSKILQQTEGISPEDVSLEVMVVNSWELLKKLVAGKCPLACADHKTKGILCKTSFPFIFTSPLLDTF